MLKIVDVSITMMQMVLNLVVRFFTETISNQELLFYPLPFNLCLLLAFNLRVKLEITPFVQEYKICTLRMITSYVLLGGLNNKA